MLRINSSQARALQAAVTFAFEDAMVRHSTRFSPRLSRVLGPEKLRVAVRAAIRKAAKYEFFLAGPVRLFVELTFLFGSGFDSDVQYPWAGESLAARAFVPEMVRAERLHDLAVDALANIHGPNNEYTYAALGRLQGMAMESPRSLPEDLSSWVYSNMARVHPEKCQYLGIPALRSLLVVARAEALRLGWTSPTDVVLLVVLMFAFGQSCTEDPLYPWICNTLRNERVAPELRSKQLRKKSLTWLRHVLDNRETSK